MARTLFASFNEVSTHWRHLPFLGGCIHKHQPGLDPTDSRFLRFSACDICYAFRPVRMAIEVPNNNFLGSSLVVDIKHAFEVASVFP